MPDVGKPVLGSVDTGRPGVPVGPIGTLALYGVVGTPDGGVGEMMMVWVVVVVVLTLILYPGRVTVVEFPISSVTVRFEPEGPGTVTVMSLEPIGKVRPGVVRIGEVDAPVPGRVVLPTGKLEIVPVGEGVKVEFKLANVGIPLTEPGVVGKMGVVGAVLKNGGVEVEFKLAYVGIPLIEPGFVEGIEEVGKELGSTGVEVELELAYVGIPLIETGVVGTTGEVGE